MSKRLKSDGGVANAQVKKDGKSASKGGNNGQGAPVPEPVVPASPAVVLEKDGSKADLAVAALKLDAKTQSEVATVTDAIAGPETLAAKKAQLRKCERIIKKCHKSVWDAGKALMEIRDQELFRPEFDSFEKYLAQKWGVGHSQGYRWIDAWKVFGVLSQIGGKIPLPSHESVARPLVGLQPQDQQAAWTAAVAKAGKAPVTAKLVKEAAAKFTPIKPKKVKVEATPAQADVKAAVVPAPVVPAENPAPAEQEPEVKVIDANTALIFLQKISVLIREKYSRGSEEEKLALDLVRQLRKNLAEALHCDSDCDDGEEPEPEPDYNQLDDDESVVPQP